ncbi:TAXI family TRAP transporter solute-binding subunit [bacterium]|nr:TAXI family TRAP transporter solute-binding subunit [bacterium]
MRIIILLLLLSLTVFANENFKVNLLSGLKGGTYYQISQEIKDNLKDVVDVNIESSQGAIDNMLSMISKDISGFVILQEDVLNYFFINKRSALQLVKKFDEKASPEKMEHFLSSIRGFIPLYSEEIHIIVQKGSDIKTIKNLQGKKVNLGAEKSGTRLTSAILFNIAGITVEKSHFEDSKAIELLIKGDLDAVVLVGGVPLESLKNISDDKLKLISIQDDVFKGYYTNATIPAGRYGWQKEDVLTYSTRALMVSKKTDTSLVCASKKRFAEELLKKMETLKSYGHKKWEQVNPKALIKDLPLEECVEPILKKWVEDNTKMERASENTTNP